MFFRVSKGPAGSHALSGSWEMRTIKNTASPGPSTTYQTTKNGLKMSARGGGYDAKFDGRDFPVQGDTARGTVSVKRIDDGTIEETYKQDGKVVRTDRTTVSGDGKSIRVESADKQRGTTMTYTAEKRP